MHMPWNPFRLRKNQIYFLFRNVLFAKSLQMDILFQSFKQKPTNSEIRKVSYNLPLSNFPLVNAAEEHNQKYNNSD